MILKKLENKIIIMIIINITINNKFTLMNFLNWFNRDIL